MKTPFISAKELEKITTEVYDHCGNENRFDDMAMLIIRFHGCENSGK